MIIYPSESFVSEQKLSEKKLNTYFDLSAHQQSANNDTIFSEEGVPVFVVEANGEGNKDSVETFHYTVLPVIDFVCFEVFNQKAEAKDAAINLKPIITQWTNYVQAVRSHTSLYPTQCKWQKHNLDMNENQLALYNELESLLLTDDLKELDDIIRVSCGAAVNANSGKVTEFQLASTLAQNFSQLAKASNMLKQGENCAIEKAALEVKCEKLSADVTAIENIAAENKAQLQRKTQEAETLAHDIEQLKSKTNADSENKNKQINALKAELSKATEQLQVQQKEAESLRENNLSQAKKLETALSDRQQSEEKLNQQLQQVEQELAKALSEKVEAEANFEKQIQAQEQKLAEVLKEKDESITELKQESELAQLQIIQLQEELEALFSEKNQAEANFEKQIQAQEQKLLEVLKENEESITELKQEGELARLQIVQLQEELETVFAEKQEREAQHKTELKQLKEELSNALVEQNNRASNAANDLQAENELMQLQILQLQEELEFYFEKANTLQVNNSANFAKPIENTVIGVAKDVSENHNTLALINRLMTEQGREK